MRAIIAITLLAVGTVIFATSATAQSSCDDVDLNGDGAIDDDDVELFVALLGLSVGDVGYVAGADMDGSGSITPIDFKKFLSCR